MKKYPLIITYTGNGKGKTTAALGLLFRSLGHHKKGAVIQFIKMDSLKTGEKEFAQQSGVLWENYGSGFTWDDKENKNKAICEKGFNRVKEILQDPSFDLVILDEFTYTLEFGFLDEKEVIHFFQEYKKREERAHIVITGRGASKGIIELSDLVSEIVEVKHPFTSNIPPQAIIEY
ncbi:MAG: cob(I)yrinic acid a,c-diamide adenosyltransferase [Spirochaetia bacterium]|nr:cob(I)yrinic acid a,c-diamide adenosyltransferase [Spirochaetia bacterium]